MTDRELFEKALKEMSQREGLTQEERKRRCGELLVQAQYMDPEEYLRWMNDSTKRPWVGLTEDEWKELWEKFNDDQDGLEEEFQERMTVKHGEGYYLINPEESWKSQQELIQRLVEAKLREKNT